MNVINLNAVLPQEDVPKYFALEGSRLYKRLASGAVSLVKSRDGGQIVTLFKGQRLVGADIAWCLIYGNWPEYPIAQLRWNPLDFSEDNLYPARLRRLRYIERQSGNLYFHPLSQFGHSSPERCRANWEELAREFYVRDMAGILRMEAANRELRAKYLRETAAARATVPQNTRPVRGSRPVALPGMEWHWWMDRWISVPVACHVADDYRVRIEKQELGAVRFVFNPETRRVDAFDAAGAVV